MCTAIVRKDGLATHIDWAHDSPYRFYPAQEDDLFGYILHPIDIATNKALAAADRREARDVADLLEIDKTIPLGAVVWAAVAKNPGYSPQSLIREIRRNAQYVQEDFDALDVAPRLDAGESLRALREALSKAEAFVERMPADQVGLLYLKDGQIVEPNPARLDDFQTRASSKGGIPRPQG